MQSESSGYYYIIENCVEFRPEDNLLYSYVTEEKVTLFVAASRCLQLLLSQQGMLVTQEALFDAGWEKYGVSVSNNTFYQNILTLRKAFKSAGCDKALIKTVPRQGLTIPMSIQVERIPLSIVTADPINEPVEPENFAPVNISAAKKSHIGSMSVFYSRWAIITYLVIFFCLLFVFFNQRTLKDNYFDNYNYVGKVDGCSVYAFSNRVSVKMYSDFFRKNQFYCKGKKFVYFATYRFVQRASVIRCEHPFHYGIKNNCISEYYLEWLQQNE